VVLVFLARNFSLLGENYLLQNERHEKVYFPVCTQPYHFCQSLYRYCEGAEGQAKMGGQDEDQAGRKKGRQATGDRAG
jgi:hypothetical protein